MSEVPLYPMCSHRASNGTGMGDERVGLSPIGLSKLTFPGLSTYSQDCQLTPC